MSAELAAMLLGSVNMAKSILIVDDSISVRGALKLALSSAKYDVIEAVDGVDALEKLGAGGAAKLVICDVNMPRMDGLTFLKAMKARAELRFTPVVMLTTEGHKDLIEQGKAAGAKAWMTKPFQADKLLALVTQLIGA